jgi:hypothetical protein
LEIYNIIDWLPRKFHSMLEKPHLYLLLCVKPKETTVVIEDLFDNPKLDEKEMLRVELAEKEEQHKKDNGDLFKQLQNLSEKIEKHSKHLVQSNNKIKRAMAETKGNLDIKKVEKESHSILVHK